MNEGLPEGVSEPRRPGVGTAPPRVPVGLVPALVAEWAMLPELLPLESQTHSLLAIQWATTRIPVVQAVFGLVKATEVVAAIQWATTRIPVVQAVFGLVKATEVVAECPSVLPDRLLSKIGHIFRRLLSSL